MQLIEIVVAADFRKVGHVTLARVSRAHAFARRDFGIEYPFAHDELKLETLGGHIIRWLQSDTADDPVMSVAQSVNRPEQFSLPGLVADRVRQIEYLTDHLAARWFPTGADLPIVVDPELASGLPTIRGRGITVAAIERRWLSGQQTIEFIAEDLELEPRVVERVLQYAYKMVA
ncbi:MAG: DUF433 domain-containing protein [Chloroflexi bacterium]|nr:DUF433 domain-containing protein [Chloroflexota bacterium]